MKARITHVVIVERKNTGAYAHAEMTVNAEIAEGCDYEKEMKSLRAMVSRALDLDASVPSSEPKTVAASPERVQNVTDKVSGAEAQINYGGVVGKNTLPSGQDIPAVIKDEPKKSAPRSSKKNKEAPASGPSDTGAVVGGASTVVGHVDTANVTTVQSETPKAATPVKGVVLYDPTQPPHRTRWANYMNANHPGWTPDEKFGKAESPAKSDYVTKIKAFSQGLKDVPFEDDKANILDSFKEVVAKFFA